MTNSVKIFLLIALMIMFSCEDKIVLVKCKDCVTEEPVDTDLEIKLDSPYINPTLINIYEGNLEDSVIYKSLNFYGSSTAIKVNLNKKYTVTATYHTETGTYVAVDSATPRVRFEKNQCDDPCYYVYDKDIDLKLKYTK